MKNNSHRWEKLGRLLVPDPAVGWMSTWAGPAAAVRIDQSSRYTVYMAGRDVKNRSQIGSFEIDINDLPRSYALSSEPVLSFSEPGAFDENGVSYPWAMRADGRTYLYFNGWMPTVLTPFQIHLGLAVSDDGQRFKRVSRAPILERTDDDHLSIGSVGVLKEGDKWHMWYTCFLRWGQLPGEHKHYYTIKYASSLDGVSWLRENITCIDFKDDSEFSICRPTVIRHAGLYHMWFSHRGEHYRIGYAHSSDGVHWQRDDSLAGIDVSADGWDSEGICYSFVFQHGDALYMLYCGNGYGREGLGIARLQLP